MSDWRPEDDLIVTFDDKTGVYRTAKEIDCMVQEMSDVANKYGFSVVEKYVGHGLGRKFHQRPNVPQHLKSLAVSIATCPRPLRSMASHALRC